MAWEFVFFMLILKIPIVYLGCVVYWAVKSGPVPPAGAALLAVENGPEPRSPWSRATERPRRRSPQGGPARMPLRTHRSPLPHSGNE